MDVQLAAAELSRYEAERRLRSLPREVLETSWAAETQVEAVIDAVLLTACQGNGWAYRHARHVGEWCARIARALPFGPDEQFARRCGVLADADPHVLWRVRELRRFAPAVSEYQHVSMFENVSDDCRAMSLILSVAEEFETRAFSGASWHEPSPRDVLRVMRDSADSTRRRYVDALQQALLRRAIA